MVRIERISKKSPEIEHDPKGERFKLIEIYMQKPNSNPDDTLKICARPYEWENDLPVKFATSCPKCGEGIWFECCDICTAIDKLFVSCPNCDAGSTTPTPKMIDPFVNPITKKIDETLLDSNLDKANDLIESDNKTVWEKLKNANVNQIDMKYGPQDDELDKIINDAIDKDQSEISQILEELEGKK